MITSATIGAVATVAAQDWRDDGRTAPPNWSQTEKLAATDPLFLAPLAGFLANARALGIPLRINNTWRPWFTQAAKLRAGVSRVDTSYHNHVTPDLQPAALSADLTLGEPPPESALQGAQYRETMGKALRALALQYGLAMGWFGLGVEKTPQNALTQPLGWDPWHIQLLRPPYTIGELRDLLQARYLANGVTPAVEDGVPLPDALDTATTDLPDDIDTSDSRISARDDDADAGLSTGAILAIGAITVAAIAFVSADER